MLGFATACGPRPAPTLQPFYQLLPTPAPIPSPTAPPQPPLAATPQAADCDNGARFLEDLTIPDGTVVQPGATLDKQWSVENAGTCDWGPGYRLVHVGGEGLAGAEEIALFPARAGTTAIWRVELVAPQAAGEYTSRWQARGPDGLLFGDEVFVLIVVEAPTSTGSPPPTAAP